MNLPKTAGQCKYMIALNSGKPIIVGTGPAGSGKTMLACHVAAEHIRKQPRGKIVLTRPIVAADEDMGYLPGDMNQKWNHGHDQCMTSSNNISPIIKWIVALVSNPLDT